MRITRILNNSNAEFAFNNVAQLLISLALILILVGLNASYFSTYLNKAKISEGFTLITTLKQEVTAYYFENGEWPKPFREIRARKYDHDSVKSIEFDGHGGLHIRFNENAGEANDKILSLVAATSTQTSVGNLLWLCGYANPPSTYQLTSTSLTNLPPQLITFSCRDI